MNISLANPIYLKMICRRRINLLISYQSYINILCNKHFHLSHFSRVRKPPSARRASNSSYEDVQEHAVSGVFHDPPNNVNVYKNFYGVEGDEGVINVDELGRSDKSIHNLSKMTLQESMNEFRSFNFGAIRLDNENKPSYYAPRRSVKLNDNDKKKTQRKNIEQSKNRSTVENLKNEINDNLNINQNEQIATGIFEPNSLPFKENNFPSYDRFHDNVSGSNKIIHNASLTGISSPSETNVHDKKKYSADSCKGNNCQPEASHVTESYEQNQFSNNETARVSESFIDKYYFTDSDDSVSHIGKSSDNIVKEQNFTERHTKVSERLPETSIHDLKKDIPDSFAFQSENSHVIDTYKQNHFDPPKVSESFIDKYYFDDAYAENTGSQTDKLSNNFVEEQYFKESNLNASEFVYETVLDSQTNDNHFLSNNEDSKPNIVSKKITFNAHQNEKQSYDHQNDVGLNPNINVQNLTEKNAGLKLSEIKTVPYEKYKLKKEDLQEKFDKNKYSSNNISNTKTDLTDASKKDSGELSQTKNHDKEVNSEQILDSSEKSNDKECLDENKIETAFDFVKKLKRNKLLTDDIKKGISAKKEKKVDSKGFRILKHQVPSLEYFTRDEMLELLKGRILYTDEDIVVLNKPYNLVIHESSTSKDLACLSRYLDDLAKLLDQNANSPQLITVHRLDKETTGCLLLARNEVSAARLKSLFAQRKIVKTYWIVTTQVPDPMDGIIDIPISEGKIEKRSRMVLHPNLPDEVPYVSHSKAGKQAITQYSVIAVSGNAALVEVRPETGIKHQIRVHFGFALGCPILGDHKYSHLDKLVPQKLTSDLLQKLRVRQSKVRHIPLHIHSKHIFIPQYSNERNLFVTAPLPNHMSENLRFLKFKKK